VLLHFLDLSSYPKRKNPDGVIEVFEAIRSRRPFEDLQLVLKAKRGEDDAAEWLQPVRERVPDAVFLPKPLTALETRSLINCCDFFASLHRAEGFGRGPGEAMFLGRLALATGWSGNLDYMDKDNSLLVDHRLIPVRDGEYPFGEGQLWADPDVDHAVALLNAVIENRPLSQVIAARGRRDVRVGHSYRAVGIKILNRASEIRDKIISAGRWRPVRAQAASRTPLRRRKQPRPRS
jgi:glycosyltransferase involved in cell wall biosynthesis